MSQQEDEVKKSHTQAVEVLRGDRSAHILHFYLHIWGGLILAGYDAVSQTPRAALYKCLPREESASGSTGDWGVFAPAGKQCCAR